MTGREKEIVDTGALKKDPVGMYSDLNPEQYPDLKSDSLDELYYRLERMTDQDVAADQNPAIDDVYETYDTTREHYKTAIENEIKMRESMGEKSLDGKGVS